MSSSIKMKKLIFATQNKHKVEEIQNVVGSDFNIVSLNELNFFEEIPETGLTLKENALQKSQFVNQLFNIDCFADDTGLEIEALGGEPRVFSARYAGEGKSFEDNMNKVLQKMEGISNRKAKFTTVIALIMKGKQYFFEGSVEGLILTEKKGNAGFGYDPIFKPNGFDLTYAQMSIDIKNIMSHRAIATKKLIAFLKS